MIDEIHGKEDDLSRLDFVIEASYESSTGRRFIDTFPIHFEAYEGYSTVGTPPLIDIARDLGRIEASIGSLASGFKKLQVVAHTRREIEADNKVIRRAAAKRREAHGGASQPGKPKSDPPPAPTTSDRSHDS